MRIKVSLAALITIVAVGCSSAAEPPEVGPGAASSLPASVESPPASIETPSDQSDQPPGPAEWWVDPAVLPLPASTTVVHVLLLEQACHGFATPEGRIVGPEITYGADAVVVTFRVRPLPGGATCPGTPPYPVTIRLDEPLAGRTLIDGGSNREATMDPSIVQVPVEDCWPLAGTSDGKVACEALIGATLGKRYREFATVSVTPAGNACPGDVCTTAKGIAARKWRVDAADRQGQAYQWRCSYRDERATCEQAAEPSPS